MASKSDENCLHNFECLKAYVDEHHHLPPKSATNGKWMLNFAKYTRKKIKDGSIDEWKKGMVERLMSERWMDEHTGGRRKNNRIMALIGDYNYVPKVAWVSDLQRNNMQLFMKGAVYCWCKNRKGEWFAARDLLGGDNYFWQGTPLIDLFTHYQHQGYSDEEAVSMAGKDAGKLLMEMLDDDKRTYETRSAFTREYRWTGVEDND